MLRSALCLLEEIFVVLVGRREYFRRRHDFERRPIPTAERSRLRERNRRYDAERENHDGDPAQTFVEIHRDSQDTAVDRSRDM